MLNTYSNKQKDNEGKENIFHSESEIVTCWCMIQGHQK